MPKLKAVILVGGPGMRLRPLTEDRPKSVVPVLNRPAMEHTFAYLRQHGIQDIILAINYLPDVLQGYLGDGSRCGVRLTYCLEKEPLGTAGAVKNAAAYLDNTFLVMNGDIFTDLNLADMLAFHKRNKARATISLTWVDDPSAFGVVDMDSQQKIKKFIEKPPLADAPSHWINAGAYFLEPEVLPKIPANTHYMFENGLFPGLLAAGDPVYGYSYRGFWLDMGNPAKYFSLNIDLLMSRVKSPLISLSGQAKNGVYCGKDVSVHPSATIIPPVIIGDGCRIGPKVKIKGPVVMGRDCCLGEGAVVENAVLWDNITIGTKAKLAHCIVSSRAIIDDKCEVVDYVLTPAQKVPLSL
jgi:mannose-1-phosphate guanylyltransferase/phosphomannomutase